MSTLTLEQLLDAIATAMQNPRTGVLGPKKGKGNVTGAEVIEWLMSTRKSRAESLVIATQVCSEDISTFFHV